MKKATFSYNNYMGIAFSVKNYKKLEKLLMDFIFELIDNDEYTEYGWTMSKNIKEKNKKGEKLKTLYGKYPQKRSNKEDLIKRITEGLLEDKSVTCLQDIVKNIDISVVSTWYNSKKLAEKEINSPDRAIDN